MATRKPRPGSKPLPKADELEEPTPPLHPAQEALPPWKNKEPQQSKRVESWWEVARRSGYTMSVEELQPFRDAFKDDLLRREREDTFSALQKARAKVEMIAGDVRDSVFIDWVSCCVAEVNDPREWTQARILYESYLRHAKVYGKNRSQVKEATLELATETQWGRMMAAMFTKKRRSTGWHYPLRVKRGA